MKINQSKITEEGNLSKVEKEAAFKRKGYNNMDWLDASDSNATD